jgi:hypothetical protein
MPDTAYAGSTTLPLGQELSCDGLRMNVCNWHEADLSTYFCNVRFWGAEMPAFATGIGREADAMWP